MTTILPASTYAVSQPSPLDTDGRRRRRVAARTQMLLDAGTGVASLATTPPRQLPFTARASVRVSNTLLYPVLGAVLGTFLLGPIGTVAGGVAGWLLAR